ncbi:MAG: sortase [Bacteroidales bacterium]|nr:sortase [Bacteroidales bacterium]
MLIKRKKNNTRTKKSRLLTIVGSLIFLFGAALYSGKQFYDYVSELEDTKKVEQFFEIQEEIVEQEDEEVVKKEEQPKEQNPIYNYIGILEIPKIDVKRGFTSLNNKDNNVNRNIQVIEKSDMPNIENGNLIIAGHSGSGRVAYFRNLYKLEISDKCYVYYNNKKYTYEIVDTYDVEKTGKVAIKRDKKQTTLVLITCRHNTNKQIVYIANLVSEEDM